MKIQLYIDGKEILGTDGIMFVDGRLNDTNVRREIKSRNARYKKNFPHKIANGFAYYHKNCRDTGMLHTL